MSQVIAIDCEMVGVEGPDGGEISQLGQVSVVGRGGNVIYNEYVWPRYRIINCRTRYSGLTEQILREKGRNFESVRREVCNLIRGNILVGHSLKNDLRALRLSHPEWNIRDTTMFSVYKNARRYTPSLEFLARRFLGVQIRVNGRHSCVEDAQTAMKLYNLYDREWEQEIGELYFESDSDSWSETVYRPNSYYYDSSSSSYY